MDLFVSAIRPVRVLDSYEGYSRPNSGCCRSFALTLLAVLHRNLGLLEKYVDGRDSRLLLKALRYTNYLRQHLPVAEVRAVVATHVLDRERVAAIEALAGAVLDVRSEPVSVWYGLLARGAHAPGMTML